MRRSNYIKKSFIPAVTCLAFAAQVVNVSAAPKVDNSGWFFSMSNKTRRRIKSVVFTVFSFVVGLEVLKLFDNSYTKYRTKESGFSSKDFSKDVSPEVVELFTKPGSKLSFLKNNKKGAALAAEFIENFRKSYNKSGGKMLLKEFSSGVDYGKNGKEYAEALNSLPVGYLTDSGIFSKSFSDEEDRAKFVEFFDDAISRTRYSISQANLNEKLKKAAKTPEDYSDDIAQMYKGSTLQIKKMGAEALSTGAQALVQTKTVWATVLAMLFNMGKSVLDDNVKQQEKLENGGKQW